MKLLATITFSLMIAFPVASMAGLAPDADGDGVPDVLDNCLQTDTSGDPSACDTDIDGYGNACDCDMNNDFTCDFGPDFAAFLGAFSDFSQGNPFDPDADMTCDNVVDFGADFARFLGGFGDVSQGNFGPFNAGGGEALNSGLGCAGQGGCN